MADNEPPAGAAEARSIRVLVVDDQPVIRRGLALMLALESDLEVLGQAANGAEALELARAHRPDVVLMDLQMPRVDGVAATRAITAELAGTQVVVLTTFDTDELVFDAIRAGAQAYLLKDASEADVLETIRAVSRGESRLAPHIARKVMEEFRRMPSRAGPAGSSERAAPLQLEAPAAAEARAGGWSEGRNHAAGQSAGDALAGGASAGQARRDDPAAAAGPTGLTRREERILALIADGLSNKEIAREVFLAEGTVKNYVSRIMEKLHARTRTELAVKALRTRRG